MPGIGQFLDVEQEVTPAQPVNCDMSENVRVWMASALRIWKRWIFATGSSRSFTTDSSGISSRCFSRFAGFCINPQRLHQVDLFLKEPVNFRKTGIAPVIRALVPHHFHLFAVGLDDLIRDLSVFDMPGGILKKSMNSSKHLFRILQSLTMWAERSTFAVLDLVIRE